MKEKEMNLYLMQADEKVLKFDIDKGLFEIMNEDLLPYSLKNKFWEVPMNASVDTILNARVHNRMVLTHFLANRVLNLSRENAKKILNAYNFSQDLTDDTKARIAITCKAVSITDSYWISDGSMEWSSINPRKTSLNEIVAHIALKGSSLTLEGRPETPELTGQGAYAKAWIRESDGLYLYKRGSERKNDREIDAEISASEILDCFNVDHVKYEYSTFDGVQVSKCKNMASENLSLVSAEEVYSYYARNDKEFLRFCMSVDRENILKMCIVDYLISNSDRHGKNWGFYKDNKTGELISCHPLFDHNNSFDEEFMTDIEGGPSLVFSGKTKKEAALYAIKRCDFEQIKPLSPDMFIDERCQESFVERMNVLNIQPEFEKQREIDDYNEDYDDGFDPAEE